MIGQRRVVAVVPGRGGSKGVPGKNWRVLGDKPLIRWSVEAALGCREIDDVVVTSDDERVLKAAGAGVIRVMRPAALAQDTTPMLPAVLHAVEGLEAEVIVLLQPTSPLRTSAHIHEALALWEVSGASSVVSVVKPSKSPYWMYQRDEAGRLKALFEGGVARRQELPQTFALNGAIYVVTRAQLEGAGAFVTAETVGYEMDAASSLDIDEELDWVMVEAVLKRRGEG